MLLIKAIGFNSTALSYLVRKVGGAMAPLAPPFLLHCIVWHFMGNVSKKKYYRLTHNKVIGSEKTNHFGQSITFYFLPFSKKKKKKIPYT